MRQFVSANDHSGNPNDNYNTIQEANFRAQLRAAADFILEEQEGGMYSVTKKPTDYTGATTVQNAFDFANDHEKVLIGRVNGTYERFNFDFESQFPTTPEEA